MARSLQEQYDDCDAHIAAIESGAQTYGVGGRQVQKARYLELTQERRQLRRELDAFSYPMVSVAQVDRPS